MGARFANNTLFDKVTVHEQLASHYSRHCIPLTFYLRFELLITYEQLQ